MTYPGLFSSYDLSGRDWLRKLKQEDPEAVQVFVQIGLEETGHGQKGREYMSNLGRIGAIATNSKKLWNRLMQEELERELGVTFDY